MSFALSHTSYIQEAIEEGVIIFIYLPLSPWNSILMFENSGDSKVPDVIVAVG